MTNELALAAEHDAAGRHDDAVDALARATQRGDLDATVALAKRLLVGDRAPCLPNDAASLLFDALKAGHAEAALRLAPLTALGAYARQSWSDALGMLVLAAEQGSENAQGQLRALGAPAARLARRIGAGSRKPSTSARGFALQPAKRCTKARSCAASRSLRPTPCAIGSRAAPRAGCAGH